jgi:hypothetical protein
VNAEFANYQNEASPILYYYGSSELYNSGTNIIKLNRLIAINGALNTDSGFIPSTAYTEEIDQTLSHTAITAGISYNSSTHQITIPYTIYAHTFQLMLKYKYNSGGTVFPLDGS